MSEIKIGLSKKKLLFAFIGSIIFIVIGIQFIQNPERYISLIMKNVEIIRIAGFASLIFFSLCLIYILFKAFDKKPGLIINQLGVIDNSNYSSVGLVKWSEIVEIRTEQIMSTKFILIDVLNPEKFIAKNKKFTRSLMKSNFKTYGTPITITSNSLDCNFDYLEKLLHSEFNKYKNA